MFRSLTLKRKSTTYKRRPEDKSDYGQLPKEALACIFQFSDNTTLSSALNVCQKWKYVGHEVVQDRLLNEHLTIILEQEGRLRFTLDYYFAGFDLTTQMCSFHTKPKKFKYYHGTSRKPNLASISRVNQEGTSIITDKPVPFNVKEANMQCIISPSNWKLNYFVEKETALFRRSERWITPLSFECPLAAFVCKVSNKTPRYSMLSWVRRSSILRRNTIKDVKKPVKEQSITSGFGLSRAKTFPHIKFTNSITTAS